MCATNAVRIYNNTIPIIRGFLPACNAEFLICFGFTKKESGQPKEKKQTMNVCYLWNRPQQSVEDHRAGYVAMVSISGYVCIISSSSSNPVSELIRTDSSMLIEALPLRRMEVLTICRSCSDR